MDKGGLGSQSAWSKRVGGCLQSMQRPKGRGSSESVLVGSSLEGKLSGQGNEEILQNFK